MGRAEAYAMANKPWPSFLDGLGNALGYAWILIAVALFREIGGSGQLLIICGSMMLIMNQRGHLLSGIPRLSPPVIKKPFLPQ